MIEGDAMTMYLPNDDIRPTGLEPAEFIEPPEIPPAQPRRSEPDNRLEVLEELVEENASVAGDVIQVRADLWAVHGFVPVDGDVLMGEFASYDEATRILGELPERTRRRDDV